MTQLIELQKRFMAYLTEGQGSINNLVLDDDKLGADTRLGIYRNAYRLRLREAIDNDHEILGLYLGDDLFEEMVAGYTQQHPSHYRSLRQFANQLPTYLATTEPFKNHPIIAEIAAFERLLLDVFDAPEVPRSTLTELQQLAPEQWPNMQLRLHPSVQLFNARWNSVESWQQLRAEQAPEPATEQPDSLWLMWRSIERLSEFRSCEPLEWNSLQLALRGGNFADLCEQAATVMPEQQVGEVMAGQLQEWLSIGIVSQIVIGV
ncbi:DNA-binding domain-containing protein [Porticoccus sp. W117]|uniref:HvfC/BufC N-terminal domain-containing protein n=1 Tax=Porticoccus sp. W117 TaxID=3054777 RepID=UPI00259847D3|nr:DNA-binding domain-containing protein [Porticoccus sp. W117]MDM3871592.1 DNA-binding domain-containing protein [Porticoccus sp. W117]